MHIWNIFLKAADRDDLLLWGRSEASRARMVDAAMFIS
jgi:hypothetical protein